MNAGFFYKTSVTYSAVGTGTADVTTVLINSLSDGSPAIHSGYGKLVAQLVAAAPTGGATTPTLDVKIQESFDGTNWGDVVAFTQATTSATAEIKKYTTGPIAPMQRLHISVATASGTATYAGTVYLQLSI